MNDCIFCKIVDKQIPAKVLFENDAVMAIMDIGPIIKGHALVISKQHHATLLETPPATVALLHQAAQKIAEAQMNAFGADGVNIMQNNGTAAGQVVPHIHIHVIPRFQNDGHHWNWNAKSYSNLDEMNQLAEKIVQHL
jgi:histidine triad (HIT) family protein